MQTVVSPTLSEVRRFQIFSCSDGTEPGDEPWVLHAEGKIRREPGAPSGGRCGRPDDILRGMGEASEGADFYSEIRELGNDYGPCHQGIRKIWRGENAVLAEICVPGEVERDFGEYQLHPALLDAVWQALGAALLAASDDEARPGPRVPIHVDHIAVRERAGARMWSYASVRRDGNAAERAGDIDLIDESGAVLVETRGLPVVLLGSGGGTVGGEGDRPVALRDAVASENAIVAERGCFQKHEEGELGDACRWRRGCRADGRRLARQGRCSRARASR